MFNEAVHIRPRSLKIVPYYFKTQKICNEVVQGKPYTLGHVLDHFVTQEMWNEVMYDNPAAYFHVPDRFITQEMCIKAIEVDLWQQYDVPDHFKTQEMCDDVVWGGPFSLQYVPYWFLTQQQIKSWHDDNRKIIDDNRVVEWYEGYQKRKAQKAKIKEELMMFAWHPDRVMDWCMSEDKKRWWKQHIVVLKLSDMLRLKMY